MTAIGEFLKIFEKMVKEIHFYQKMFPSPVNLQIFVISGFSNKSDQLIFGQTLSLIFKFEKKNHENFIFIRKI